MVFAPCDKCFGYGTVKEKDTIGTIRPKRCEACNGLGSKDVAWGSGEHRIGANIGAMRKSGQL